MITLTRRGWGMLFGALGVWGSWWLIQLRDLWYLAAFLLVLVLLATAITALGPRLARVEVQVSVSDPTPTVGDTILVTAHVRQRAGLGFRLALRWLDAEHSTPLTGGEISRESIHQSLSQRGRQDMGVAGTEILGPLGLASRRLNRRVTTEILVLPQLIPELEEMLSGGGQQLLTEENSASISSLHNSGIPAGAVREYQAGDTRRQIHWKQSARQGELLVNLHEQENQPQRTFLLVTHRRTYHLPVEFERAVSAVATLAVCSMREGCRVRLTCGTDTLENPSVDEALLYLAVLERADVVTEPLEGTVHAVVTGGLSATVTAALEEMSPSLLIITSPGHAAAKTPGWSRVIVDD